MKLVDTDDDRPDDEIEPPPHANPPRPEKRRAAASLILTVTILVGTVVTIYTVFPKPGSTDVVAAAIRAHRDAAPTWQLVTPERNELEAWTIAQLGEAPPLPPDAATITGARPIAIRGHRAVVVGYQVGADPVSMLIERGASVSAKRTTRAHGEDVADSWRDGPWSFVVVGPSRSSAAWRPALGVP